MKTILIALFFFVFLNCYSQTVVPAGNVSGTWTFAGSPYQITGDIQILNGQTLSIDPGVTIEFQGTYKLNVQGCLLAIGAVADTIVFTAADINDGWSGIRFDNTPASNDSSKIQYCKLMYRTDKPVGDNKGGAVFFNYFSKVVISNSRISNCKGEFDGGGISINYSNPRIVQNIISGNTLIALSRGAGIYIFNSKPTIAYNAISNNTSEFGAGIFTIGSTPTISNNTISNNSSTSAGAGIYVMSNASIINNVISYNSFGGGIHIEDSAPILNSNTISNNTGGGILLTGGFVDGTIITNNTISNNNASSGGGIGISSTSTSYTISNNVISNNNASNGGGISYSPSSVIIGSLASISIVNNIISNNSATNGGGLLCTTASPTFSNNTIVNNSATNGGALNCSNNSDVTLYNCIFYGNTAGTNGAQVYLTDDASDPNFYYCNIQSSFAGFGLNGNIYSGIYSNNIDAAPQFVSPSGGSGTGFNGVTADWFLQSTSPCIDKGDPSGNYPTTDKAGNPRVRVCRIDIGAYEYQSGSPLTVSVIQTQQILCHGDASAILTANPAGGTSSDSYAYAWSNGATSQSISGLTSGTYSVLVSTTISQCQTSASYTVSEPSQINISSSNTMDNICDAIGEGSASVNVTGGEIPYTYLWSNNSTTNSISGLIAGDYSVTIADNIGCVHTNTIIVGALSTTITPNITIVLDTCASGVGKINTSPSGGIGSYTYTWSNGNTTQNISGLHWGSYTITISDSLGCKNISTPMVGVYTNTIIPTLTSIPDTCTGNVGRAMSNPSGGTYPYSYMWTNGASTNNISSLASNNYSVTISDKNGCSVTSSVLVGIFTNTVTTVFTFTPADCHEANGSITALPGGGTNPYSYNWSSGNTLQTASNLLAGNYTVNITDKNGCIGNGNFSVGTSSVIATPAICMVTVDSLSQNSVIMWDKTGYFHIDSFIVYREISTNIYKRIGAVQYSNLSLFTDTARAKYFPNTGNPNSGTYRYKLQMRDSCGNYSQLSPFHNTIYIINNNGTFSWPQLYTIDGGLNPVNNYVLMRDNMSNGSWTVVGSVSGTQQTITDPQYSAYTSASWRVETQWGINCIPTRISSSIQTFNVSRSNIFSLLVTEADKYYGESVINIYPNPFSETATLQIINPLNNYGYEIKIFNSIGKLVKVIAIEKGMDNVKIDREDLGNGFYVYKLENNSKLVGFGKFVIQ